MVQQDLPCGSGGAAGGLRRDRDDVELLVAHLDAAYNLARYLTRNEADAEDVVQSAYVRAISHFDGLRGADGRAWLLMIVRNSCYDGCGESACPAVTRISTRQFTAAGGRTLTRSGPC